MDAHFDKFRVDLFHKAPIFLLQGLKLLIAFFKLRAFPVRLSVGLVFLVSEIPDLSLVNVPHLGLNLFKFPELAFFERVELRIQLGFERVARRGQQLRQVLLALLLGQRQLVLQEL